MPQSEVARTFGEAFAQKLPDAEPSTWQGPIPSSFGIHFVFISERTKGGIPPLDSVREAVQREWQNARRVELRPLFAGVCQLDRLDALLGRLRLALPWAEPGRLRLELQPVHGGRASHEQQFVLLQVEQDPVADLRPPTVRRRRSARSVIGGA